ncbi:MAG: hypothetical protein ACP5OA_04925 [Candidatus Woesearchaeota archaeon]
MAVRRMLYDKKGFTYLLVTSLLVIVLLGIFFTTSNYTYQDQESLQQIRIRAMNDFIKNLDTDIHRATYIAAFRTMLSLEDHVTITGQYLSNVSDSFKETFFYGTINGTSSAIMENSTFNDYLMKVDYLSQSIGIALDMNVTNIRIVQSTPWTVDVFMLINISAMDNKNTASWSISKEYMTRIPIDNLRDPLYSKNSFNRMPNTIKQFYNDTLVDGTNITNLIEYIEGSYYVASPDAPSFIMRFEGSNASDLNGIESIVNVEALSAQDIPVYRDRVKVDYIYFHNLEVNSMICDVEDIPVDYYFIIPANRAFLYQVDGLNYSTTCP